MAANTGPRSRKSHKPQGNQLVNNLGQYQNSFDKDAFSQLIRSQGVRMLHYRAIPDCQGMASRGDGHAVQSTRSDSDGYIYKEAGIITSFFSSNSQHPHQEVQGLLPNARAYITAPDFYDDKPDCPVLFSAWDRLFLMDIEIRVVTNQFVEASRTGIDRLQFPATCVEHLIDSHGIEYFENIDFKITEEGNIQWLGQKQPGFDAVMGRGRVYTIRYRYTPFFIVNTLLHEIRVSQITNMSTGKRSLERMPYQVEVVREFVFKDKNRDPLAPQEDARFQDAPAPSGRMGPQE
jgi:hypothetical protein